MLDFSRSAPQCALSVAIETVATFVAVSPGADSPVSNGA